MKKILVLGANKAQIPLIKTAKSEGYYVVCCDYTTTNPGLPLVDKHYQVNFMNMSMVLEIAHKEKIQGVISNSEAAMPIVAYVAESMGLVGNSLKSINTLSSKHEFRELQHKLDLFAPQCVASSSFDEALEQAKTMTFPVIMKPCHSSGSRGLEIIADYNMLNQKSDEWRMCSLYSLDKKVVIEEYIEMSGIDNVIDGDIFVYGDHIFWDGLFTSKRSANAPMVPMTQSYPAILTEEQLAEVKDSLTKLLREAGIVFGEYNIEMFYGANGKLFCIEINARQGGNGIPYVIEQHCGINMYKLLVTTAMGNMEYYNTVKHSHRICRYISRHPVFSSVSGIYNGLSISDNIKPHIKSINELYVDGDKVNKCVMASDVIAFVDVCFDNREQQIEFVNDIEMHISPMVKPEEEK